MARWFQYPSKTEPLPDIVVAAVEVVTSVVETSFLFVKELIFPTVQEPVPLTIPPPTIHVFSVTTALVAATTFMYPALAEPVPVPATAVDMDSWFRPFSEPQRSNKISPALATRAGKTDPDDTTADRWFIPWPDSVRRPIFRASRQDIFEPPENPIVSFGWYQELSRPSAKPWQRTDKQDEYTAPVFVPTAETVTVDKWFVRWLEPVRVKGYVDVTNLSFTAVTVSSVTAIATNTTSASVIFERRVQYQGKAEPVFVPTGETVTVDKWFAPWREPVRSKPFYHLQQTTVGDTDPIVSFGWFESLSEPIRLKPNLREGAEPFFSIDVEPTVPFGWAYPWSEPVRTRLFPAAQQQALAWGTFTPETFTDTKWFTWLSEPVRIKAGLAAWQQQFFQPDNEPSVSFGWAYPWSEPVRQKRGLGAQFQQAFTIDPFILTRPEQVSEDKWHQGWPDFARAKPGLPAWQQQTLAFWPFPISGETVTLDKYWQPFSEPVRQKQGLGARFQQFLAIDPFILTQAEKVTEDRWHQPWSEPVRQKLGQRAALQDEYTAPVFVPAVVAVNYGWFEPFSEPVRAKSHVEAVSFDFTAVTVTSSVTAIATNTASASVVFERRIQYQGKTEPVFVPLDTFVVSLDTAAVSFGRRVQYQTSASPVFVTAAVTDIRWFAPLSEPVRLKLGLGAWQQQFLQPDAEPNVSFGWFGWLSDPIRVRAALPAPQQQPLEFDVKPLVSFGWFEPLSEPVKLKPNLREGAEQFFGVDVEPTVPFGWIYPWSEPVRTRYLTAAQQQFLAWNSFTPADTTDIKWFAPLSEPVRIKAALAAAQQQFLQPDVEPNVSFGWFGWLSEPVRAKPGLRPENQHSFTADTEPTVPFGWVYPWSEPVRTRYLTTAQQQALAWSVFTPADTTDIKWFAWLSEPVRVRAALSAAQQPVFTAGTQPVVSFGWFEPFSEPVRVKPGLRPEGQSVFAIGTQPTVSFGWIYPWSEPVKTRVFQVAQQQALAWSTFTPAAATTDIRWFAPLSEPVRLKPALLTSEQRPLTGDTKPLVSFGWYQWFSEPVRAKRALPTGEQQFFAIGTKPAISIGWYNWLSEPVRFKPAIPVSQRPVTVIDTKPRVSFGWYRPFSEPVRIKLGLLPDAQQFLAAVPRADVLTGTGNESSVLTNILFTRDLLYPSLQEPPYFPTVSNITIILGAIETGDVFAGQLQIGYCPQADVSIIEIVPTVPSTSSVYVPTVFAEASILEIEPTAPNTSSVYVQTVFAEVSIREIPLAVVYVDVSIIETC